MKTIEQFLAILTNQEVVTFKKDSAYMGEFYALTNIQDYAFKTAKQNKTEYKLVIRMGDIVAFCCPRLFASRQA